MTGGRPSRDRDAVPRQRRRPGQLEKRMSHSPQAGSVTSADGTSIAYDATGTGPALVIVHGATQFRAFDSSLAVLAGLLADRFTVINYDRRGRGESGNTLPFSPQREIEDIAALIAGLAGGRASIMGFSSGAVVALEAAASGLPIDKVVMYEPPFVIAGSGFPPPPADYVETLNAMVAAGDRDGPPTYFMRTVGLPPEAIEGARQSPMWPIMQSVGPTIAYDGQFMFDAYYTAGKFPARWAGAAMPVLVVNGDASFPFMPSAADAVAAALPHASRKILAGQGHGPKPDVLAPVLRDFLGA
jgi:pimeloyl-ACP methyl ester carboxylesterase